MSHELDTSNGQYNVALRGGARTAWHGFGNEILPTDTLDDVQRKAGLLYTIQRAIVEFEREDGSRGAYDNKHVMYRDDTGAPLSVMSDGYCLVQPAEAIEFYRDLCEHFHYQMDTAGALRGGAVFWAMATTGHDLNINGDTIRGRVLFSSSADGSSATCAGFTSERVVCANTLAIAHQSAELIKVRHSTRFDADAAKRMLGFSRGLDDAWRTFSDQMRALYTARVDGKIAEEFFATILRPEKESKPSRYTSFAKGTAALPNPERAIRGLEDMRNSYTQAPGAMPGTAFGLVQAVTHYVDHVRGRDDDKRMTSAWFGQGATMKQRAMDAALAMAGIAA